MGAGRATRNLGRRTGSGSRAPWPRSSPPSVWSSSTPGTERHARAVPEGALDATAGYEGDPKLLTAFPTECRCDADSSSARSSRGRSPSCALRAPCAAVPRLCARRLRRRERIIGISKLTRLVRLFARRFTVQERLGEQIADALAALMEPHGVAVHVEAAHLCTQMRGVQESSRTVTTSGAAGTPTMLSFVASSSPEYPTGNWTSAAGARSRPVPLRRSRCELMSGPAAIGSGAALQPLELLYETPELPAFDLPGALAAAYGGSLGFTEPRLYANFVSSVDGVTAIPGQFQSSHLYRRGKSGGPLRYGPAAGLRRCCPYRGRNAARLAADTMDRRARPPALGRTLR